MKEHAKDSQTKLLSLEGLRAIAFIGVFLSHTGIPIFQGSGACAVSLFFVLSGFLMAYTKLKQNNVGGVLN